MSCMRIEVMGGCVADVDGVPKGKSCVIQDNDSTSSGTVEYDQDDVVIVVDGGCVCDVINLPEGMTYEIIDHDC